MKKLLALLLALAMSLSLFACGAGTGGETPDGTNGGGTNGGTADGGADNGSGSGELSDSDIRRVFEERATFLNEVYTEAERPSGYAEKPSVYLIITYREGELDGSGSYGEANLSRINALALKAAEHYQAYSHNTIGYTFKDYETFLAEAARDLVEGWQEDILAVYAYSYAADSEHNYDLIQKTEFAINAITDADKVEELRSVIEGLSDTKNRFTLWERGEGDGAAVSIELSRGKSDYAVGYDDWTPARKSPVVTSKDVTVIDGEALGDAHKDYVYVRFMIYKLDDRDESTNITVTEAPTVEDGKLVINWEAYNHRPNDETVNKYDCVIKLEKSKLDGDLRELEILTDCDYPGTIIWIFD